MSIKRKNLENLDCEKVEVTNNDTDNYSHIKFTGSDEANTVTVKGTVDILVYNEKVIGSEKSSMKLATCEFTGRVNIHDGCRFAGMHVLDRNLVSIHHVSTDATDVRLEEATLDLSHYESVRLNEIIRADVAAGFYNKKELEKQALKQA